MNSSDAKKHGLFVVKTMSIQTAHSTKTSRVSVPFGVGDELFNFLTHHVPDRLQVLWLVARAIQLEPLSTRDVCDLVRDGCDYIAVSATIIVEPNAEPVPFRSDGLISLPDEEHRFFVTFPVNDLIIDMVNACEECYGSGQ